MKKVKSIISVIGVFIFLFSSGSKPDNNVISNGSQTQQTTTKSTKTTSKSQQTNSKTQKATTTKGQTRNFTDPGTVKIGSQTWAVSNLNVGIFRNGDTIPETKTNAEWKAAGDAKKPAWCYFNNDPANGLKYGRLYNWYAVSDPRNLAPKGWTLPADADWKQLTSSLGGQDAAGGKLKSTSGWQDGNNGTNESGFNGLPGGYRVENGTFMNIWNNAIWWSTTENNSISAIDFYLVLANSLKRSNSPKQRGSSVRCLKVK